MASTHLTTLGGLCSIPLFLLEYTPMDLIICNAFAQQYTEWDTLPLSHILGRINLIILLAKKLASSLVVSPARREGKKPESESTTSVTMHDSDNIFL